MWGDHVIAVAPSWRVVAGHAALALPGLRPNWCLGRAALIASLLPGLTGPYRIGTAKEQRWQPY